MTYQICRTEIKNIEKQPNFTNEVCNLIPGDRDALKIFCYRGEIAHHEQFLLLTKIFCYLLLDFHVKTGIRFSPRGKRLFEITEIEITGVDCSYYIYLGHLQILKKTVLSGADNTITVTESE